MTPALYQVVLIEVRKAIVGAPLRVRPLVGGHIGPPLQKKKIDYSYERNLVLILFKAISIYL